MKNLKTNDFMKNYNLKRILRMSLNYRKFIIILYSPEIEKYIQIKDLLLSIMVVWAEVIGFALY